MNAPPPDPTTTVHGPAGLQALVDALVADDYDVFGPHVVDDAITIRALTSIGQLPRGWTDSQQPGSYRLEPSDNGQRFGYAVGPPSWKPLLHRADVRTLSMTRSTPDNGGPPSVEVHVEPRTPRRRAFLGVRPCEAAAIARQDTVLLGGPVADTSYENERDDLLLVVVNCTTPASTCFCTSMGTGPVIADDVAVHDIEVTELGEGDDVRYLIAPVSGRGEAVIDEVRRLDAGRPFSEADRDERDRAVDAAVSSIERHVDTRDLPETLLDGYDVDHWATITERCLACGNCTAACPTCFCTTTDDVTDLAGTTVERMRHWDTCFSEEFSRLGPDIVRTSVTSRYRQWLVHKLATWHDQFGESGCVGCGRCITWCPVGIDFTAELPRLREQIEGKVRR